MYIPIDMSSYLHMYIQIFIRDHNIDMYTRTSCTLYLGITKRNTHLDLPHRAFIHSLVSMKHAGKYRRSNSSEMMMIANPLAYNGSGWTIVG